MYEGEIDQSNTGIESKEVSGVKLTYEPGNHDAHEDVRQRIDAGDLTVHTWNGDVARRMITYKPKVVGIDSLHPHVIPINTKNPLSMEDKTRIWEMLPANPRAINSSNEVMVVLGDIKYSTMEPRLTSKLSPERKQQVMDDLDSKNLSQREDAKKSNQNEAAATLGALAVVEILTGTLMLADSQAGPNFNRRKFLGLIGLGASVMLAGKIIGDKFDEVGVAADNPLIKDIANKISDVSRKRFFDDEWVDGRSAILISKSINALKSGLVKKGSEGSVLMGFGHTAGAIRLMDSPEKRADAIYALAKTMSQVIGDVGAEYRIGKRKDNVNAFLDLMAREEYVTVQDSGKRIIKPKEVQSILGSFIKYAGSAQNPEVMAAVRSLRIR